MRYTDIRDDLATGDVVAFSGKGRVSDIIKWRTASEYSHVGLVYCDETGVYLAESTTLSSLPCVVSGRKRRGAQLVPLSQRLRLYDGAAWIARIKPEPRSASDPIAFSRMRGRILDWIRRETPYDTIQAIGAGVDWWDSLFGNEADFSSLFCSELVARAHQVAGWIDEAYNPSEATPRDVMAFDHLAAAVRLAEPKCERG